MRYFAALAVTGLLLASCAGNAGAPGIPAINQNQTDQQPQSTASLPVLTTDAQAAGALPEVTTNFGGFADGSADAATVALQGPSELSLLSGPIAPANLGCATTSATSHNSVATLNLAPAVVSSGTASDSVASTYTTSTGAISSTSTIQGVNVLGGLVRATVVEAAANSGANASSATSNENGSQLAGLVVAGLPISAMPAPNTKVTLPGLGYVILNEVYGETNNAVNANGSRSTAINVNMIHVYVTTANLLGVKAGTQIVVATAHSAFTVPPAPFGESATAYSLYVEGYAGNLSARSGPWAPASIGCNFLSDTDRLATATTPVGSLGTMVNSTNATESATNSSVTAISNTASVDLFGGLISAQALVATANVTRSGSTFGHSASLTFTTLVIGGTHVSASVAPNTRITIAGLGYAIVNDQLRRQAQAACLKRSTR